jgi:hypothetical protein
MATIPTSPAFVSVTPMRRTSTAMAISPYNFTQQVYSWGGKLKVIDFQLPTMTESDATAWLAFFDDLNGFEGTFNIDLSDYFPDEAGLKSVAMRLTDPDVQYSIDILMNHSISFRAMEAL